MFESRPDRRFRNKCGMTMLCCPPSRKAMVDEVVLRDQ